MTTKERMELAHECLERIAESVNKEFTAETVRDDYPYAVGYVQALIEHWREADRILTKQEPA